MAFAGEYSFTQVHATRLEIRLKHGSPAKTLGPLVGRFMNCLCRFGAKGNPDSVMEFFKCQEAYNKNATSFPQGSVPLFVPGLRMAFPIQLRNLKMTASGGYPHSGSVFQWPAQRGISVGCGTAIFGFMGENVVLRRMLPHGSKSARRLVCPEV